MALSASTIALVTATFLAAAVEFVEAFTIVLAMGLTRSWRSTIVGTLSAVVALGLIIAVVGAPLINYVSESLMQLIVGTLLLIFGLQWLRKAILRSAGLKALHDEEATFREELDAARAAGRDTRLGLDWFSFVVSFKGVFLEGLEVAFIVITFGLSATKDHPETNGIAVASVGAALAGVLVIIAGTLAHRPLAAVPENTLKYAVGLLLSTFGLFWAGEGLNFFHGGEGLAWPGGDLAILAILAAWFVLSRLAIAALGQYAPGRRAVPADRALTTSAAG